MEIKASITGVSGYVPKYVLTNSELEKMLNTNNKWIINRTGIKERRILKEKNKGSSFMGIKAAKKLLKKTKIKSKDIDLIICSTITPDLIFPSNGNIIAQSIGAINAFTYDINAACSGFLYAITIGSQFIETKKYKKIIIIGTDKMSNLINYQDRSTCILFGDGAGAILLEPNKKFGIIDSILKSNGEGKKYLFQKKNKNKKKNFLNQKGKNVFKFAIQELTKISNKIIKKNNLNHQDIDFFIPHQANKRIIKSISNKINIKKKKIMITINKFGNTTNATIPMCLWKYEKYLKKKNKIIFSVFGAGFSWGSIYIKWSYNTKKNENK